MPEQDLVDQIEATANQRYQLQQKVTVLLADAVRRADAYSRLEAALRIPTHELS